MPEYITSRKNELIVHMKRLGADRSYRSRCREFLCDGEKLLEEAQKSGAAVTAVLTCRDACPPLPAGVRGAVVPRDLLESVSPMKNPQDLLFSCAMPEREDKLRPGGSFIILEDVQDPGNVGTVLRTAGAFGMDGVFLTGACADLYNPKTVRATMGAVFRVAVAETDLDGLRALQAEGLRIYGAALRAGCRDVRTLDLRGAAVAIGSEGHGLSQALLDLCDGHVIIPMRPECESLNAAVAASVLMWEMNRQRL